MPRTPTGPKPGSSNLSKTGLFRASVYLPEEVHEQLRRLAFERRETVSALILAAIERAYGPPDE